MAHVDRISSLTDDLLHRILSLVDIQEAVQTCILSKRWQRLWADMDSLDLCLPDFKPQSRNIERRFTRFINALLSRRNDSELRVFRLFCEETCFNVSHRSITAWVLYAIRHKAKVIEIDGCLYRSLPRDIFTCASLEDLCLRISGLGGGVVAGGVNLPQLKKLHLGGIISRNRAILRNLLSGCPALEDLSLDVCSIDLRVISSPQLKHLSIFSMLDTARIESIRTPNLVSLSLRLRGDVLRAANLEKMPFLLNAIISVDGGTGFDENCSILAAFPNVRSLELRGNIMKDLLRVELPKCPIFFNLTKLHLSELCRLCHGDLVDCMLAHSPNLEKLQLCKYPWCCQVLNSYQTFTSVTIRLNLQKWPYEFFCIIIKV
ncbi:F-box/RNI-like/FBD-like domains-containing protein [Rhynchospora pubera]|uniref:F-box/RNI-like/FBD-like domains-containing protein n=1 Tax=Rhynchospora pubera TaxID=906938 RepID=A0AAV8C9D7_9POAL|nr:F-box/RNI-like/FBD-like domains-containing protein [Rhynchospora pubera]